MEKKKKKTGKTSAKTSKKKKTQEVTAEEKKELQMSEEQEQTSQGDTSEQTHTAYSPETTSEESKVSQILWAVKSVSEVVKSKLEQNPKFQAIKNATSMAQTMLKDPATRKFILDMAKTTIKSQLEKQKEKLLKKIKKE